MSAGISPPGEKLAAYARWAFNHRWFTSLLALILISTFASFIPRLTFDNTPDSFFLEEDDTLAVYQNFKDQFETDEYSLIMFEAPPVWTAEFIEHVRQLERDLRRIEHVERVTAITNVRHIRSEDGFLEVGEFLPPDLSVEELKDRRELATSHPYYRNLYVADDGSHLGIVVETAIIKGEVAYKIVLAQRVRELIKKAPYKEWNAVAVGAPILDGEVRTIVDQESGLFGAIAFVLVGFGFSLVFRSLIGLLLPLVIAIGAIVVAFGSMGLMGAPITLLTPIIPSFLISVGVGSSIFLITQYYNMSHNGHGVEEAVVESFRHAGIACVTASLTTALALIGFSASRIAPVMQVGLVMGFGLLAALTLTFLLMPVAFSFYQRTPQSSARQSMIAGRVRMLDKMCSFVLNRPRGILIAYALLLVVALMAALQLKADYYYLGIFKEDTRIRQDYSHVDQVLPASAAVEILIKATEVDAFKQPQLLNLVDELASAIREQSDIPASVYSLANVVKEINQALNDDDPEQYQLPDNRPAISQQLLLFESSGHDELTRLTNHDYDVARLTVRVPNLPDSAYVHLVNLIQREATRVIAESGQAAQGISITVTGLVPLWMKISQYLSESQMHSIIAAFAVVTLVMMLSFRSLLLGIGMSLLNVSVVMLILGLMGALGVALDPYTILISAIALGILDDDTIHFVKNILDERNLGATMWEAIRAAYHGAGQAMFYSSAVLIFSFSAYALSSVASLTKFGLFVSLTLLLGLLLEFLITPALLLVLERMGWLRHRPVVSRETLAAS